MRGLHKLLVIARIWMRVAWLALRSGRGPVRAIATGLRLRAAMQKQQWTTPTLRDVALWNAQKFRRESGRYFWDLYAPGWPSAAFDRCVERELDRLDPRAEPPALNTAIIAITRRCALNCEHCFEWDALDRREALSAGELQEIVRRLSQRGPTQYFFSGGEPLHRFADLLVLAQSVSAGADVWVLTSGLGLTADKARRLRAAGVTGLSLSLDHWDADSHDRFRGLPGSFAAATRATRHAHDAGLLVTLSLCPTRAFTTPANLERYGQLALALGASFIQIFEPRPLGHYAGQDVTLEPEQQDALVTFCERLNSDPAYRDYPTVEYLDWGRRRLGCLGAGDRYAYVDTDGELHACPFCRRPGLRVLDHDIHSAMATLQERGCRAARRPA